jgi:hypothetical protein
MNADAITNEFPVVALIGTRILETQEAIIASRYYATVAELDIEESVFKPHALGARSIRT